MNEYSIFQGILETGTKEVLNEIFPLNNNIDRLLQKEDENGNNLLKAILLTKNENVFRHFQKFKYNPNLVNHFNKNKKSLIVEVIIYLKQMPTDISIDSVFNFLLINMINIKDDLFLLHLVSDSLNILNLLFKIIKDVKHISILTKERLKRHLFCFRIENELENDILNKIFSIEELLQKSNYI
jgi:hypothetical protein